jgi:cathepsin L
MDRIDRQNHNDDSTWTAGWTHLTDRSLDEYHNMRGTMVPDPSHPVRQITRPVHSYSKKQLKSLPESVDWRAKGWVTDVKDQGQCGSCWAFSAVGAMEGQHANVTGKLLSLSEQNLVDCVTTCSGCDGGWMNYAMEYVVENNGIDTETGYPYAGVDESCNFNSSTVGATFYEVVNITQGDTDGLLHALATIGPISVAIDAEEDLMNYQSGIYTSTTCSYQALDHGVTLVGYGTTNDGTPFYIIKNSWSTKWGLDGYVYWNRTDPDMCGIAQAASYALATKN